MITFKSINVDGQTIDWDFETVKDIKDTWLDPDCDLPANDDEVFDICIDGRMILSKMSFLEMLSNLTGEDLFIKDTKLTDENYGSIAITLDPSKIYKFPIKNGFLDIRASLDPDYPGLDIEYIDAKENVQALHTRPRVLIECPKDTSKLRALVWGDPKSEDYSDSVDFETAFPSRFSALLGPNTKQFWLYDNDNDVYIDPPASVLEELEKIRYKDGEETAESIQAAEDRLVELANEDPDWIHDGNEYSDIEP